MTPPMMLELVFWFPRPASHFGKRKGKQYLKPSAPLQPISARLGDIDKLCRAVLDSLTSVVYHDDRQVVDLLARKRYLPRSSDGVPFTRINITTTL